MGLLCHGRTSPRRHGRPRRLRITACAHTNQDACSALPMSPQQLNGVSSVMSQRSSPSLVQSDAIVDIRLAIERNICRCCCCEYSEAHNDAIGPSGIMDTNALIYIYIYIYICVVYTQYQRKVLTKPAVLCNEGGTMSAKRKPSCKPGPALPAVRKQLCHQSTFPITTREGSVSVLALMCVCGTCVPKASAFQ